MTRKHFKELAKILNENNSLTFIEWPDKFSEELKIYKEKF